MYSLPVRRLKEILRHVVPDATLGKVEELPSTCLPRLYTLNMSDERKLLLSFAPSLAVRLLRHEATLLSSEATLVYFIAGTDRKSEPASPQGQIATDPNPIEIKGLVPKVLKHSSNSREMAYPYTISEPTPGAPLSTLSIYLTLSERREVDKQVGSMVRGLASLTSPSGKFGTVSRVLPDPFATLAVANESQGSSTWGAAFLSMLEGILRDGEDMSVLLPYDVVRAHYQRLSWRMEAVTLPRLVVLDAGNETNLMVKRGSDEGTSMMSSDSVKLTGLRDWSQGIFGDPLISSAFDDPSEALLEGWRESGSEIIEDEAEAEVRMLLYKCYRAVVSIVTEYYRPQNDSSRKELEGRRKLTSALAALEKVDIAVNEALKRARSLSTEVEASKRQKVSEEGA